MLERLLDRAWLLLIGSACALSCATQRELVDRGASAGPSRCSFWPPPPSTSLGLSAIASSGQPTARSSVARRIAAQLRVAGYAEPHWYPIGLAQLHGFAATTRLEALNEDDTPRFETERWSALYPEAANLRWLKLARTVRLPHPGRYRVFLITVTDLPLDSSSTAPVWSEDTVMDGPGVKADFRSTDELERPQDLSRYRLGVYLYQYERLPDQAQGRLSPRGAEWSAAAHVRAAGLAQLSDSPLVDAP